jgi:DNA-directed RNA polymerase specialized sigma24 family protein
VAKQSAGIVLYRERAGALEVLLVHPGALTTLEDVLADNGRRASLIKKRIAQLRRSRSRGASYTELVSGDDRLIVQLLTESSKALDTSGANVRRAEAQALHAEGMTMEQIADRFGVTRQRVSTLLRKARE